MFKKACPEILTEGSAQQGRSRFDARSVLSVREHGKRATPVCASRFGKARERRWRLFSTFPSAEWGFLTGIRSQDALRNLS